MNNAVKLGAILPVLLNPATAVIGVGLGLIWWLSEDDDETTVQADVVTAGTMLTDDIVVAVTNITEPLPAVESKPHTDAPEARETAPAAISEAEQKRMIRKTMSELGKRSAAARANRKLRLLKKT